MMITTPALENRTKNIVPLMISLIKEAFALKKFKEVARIVMQDSDDLLINETGVNYLTNFSNRVKEIVKDFNDEKIRAAYTLDAGPNAWILIRDEDVQNFIQKFCKSLGFLENFLNLHQKAFVDIEAIIETSVSGPQIINYE